MILLIDNYDSFVHNLARYFRRLGQDTLVVRNDAVRVSDVRHLAPQAVVLSPGPCTPNEAGCCVEIVQQLRGQIPILGVCLGHQAIAVALGGMIRRAKQPMHGRTSLVEHSATGLFAGLASPQSVCRYHSLVVDADSLPGELVVTARSDRNTIMAFEHLTQKLWGVQFHPEATLTRCRFQLLANFLVLSGIGVQCNVAELYDAECVFEKQPLHLPVGPVTF
jgi:anthranilate synthase/aminodeoxychorismate synthase-like glutamine amidotransferase